MISDTLRTPNLSSEEIMKRIFPTILTNNTSKYRQSEKDDQDLSTWIKSYPIQLELSASKENWIENLGDFLNQAKNFLIKENNMDRPEQFVKMVTATCKSSKIPRKLKIDARSGLFSQHLCQFVFLGDFIWLMQIWNVSEKISRSSLPYIQSVSTLPSSYFSDYLLTYSLEGTTERNNIIEGIKRLRQLHTVRLNFLR